MSATPPEPSSPTPAPAPQADHDALRPGTRLDEFEVLRVLGSGGFGIVYLAMDHALERQVAIKEYMPAALATRGEGVHVSVRSISHLETFNIGLGSFVNEAKLLARFDHPSLLKVYRFWEGNGTAYMVMPYYAGRTLRDECRLQGGRVHDEAWIRGVIDPLLGALDVLHHEGVYHRDIAPDNILLMPAAPPVLLDFGAARRVINDRSQTLTAILKPSYAPIEQYADVSQLPQGPWTDFYALGAVLYFVITGKPPTPSAARAVHDEVPLLSKLEAEQRAGLSDTFLAVVDWMLSVKPGERPQSVAQLRDALDGRLTPPERSAPAIDIPTPPTRDEVRAAWDRTEPVTVTEPDGGYEHTVAITPPVPMPPIHPPADARDTRKARVPRVRLNRRRRSTDREDARGRSWGLAFGLLGVLGIAAVAVGAWQAGAQHSANAPHELPASAASAVGAASVASTAGLAASAPTLVIDSEPEDADAAAEAASAASEPAADEPMPPVSTGMAFGRFLESPAGAAAARPASPAQPKKAPIPPSVLQQLQQSSLPGPDAAGSAVRLASASPREACSGKRSLAQSACVARECRTAAFHDHPACVKLRQDLRTRRAAEQV